MRGPVGASTLGQLRTALGDAARDLRSRWRWRWWSAPAAFALAAGAPLAVSSTIRVRSFAAGMYVALAAVGLNAAMGLGGMPSLGQGAFMGIGGFTCALLMVRAGAGPAVAAVGGLVAAILAGLVVGAAAVRLRGPFVAMTTWVVTWLVAFVLAGFPWISGGVQGLVMPDRPVRFPGGGPGFHLTPGVHYEIGLTLLALALVAYAVVRKGAGGMGLAAVRQGRAEAEAVGVRGPRLQLGAFVASAAAGGLAGALGVQLAGVADPTAFGPLLSIELFLAVLLGGAGSTFGPVLGAAILVVIPRAAGAIGAVAGIEPERFQPLVAAVLLLAVLVAGRGAGFAWMRRVRRLFEPGAEGTLPLSPERGEPVALGDARERPLPGAAFAALEGKGLVKRFGGLVALGGVNVSVAPGEIHALIGPNGSGKTTCLRILAGTMAPDHGAVLVGAGTSRAAPFASGWRPG